MQTARKDRRKGGLPKLVECLFLNEQISKYFSNRSQFDMNDGIVILQFILNWMKPNNRIFNPALGFFDLPYYIPENSTYIDGSCDEFRFHLSNLVWDHSPMQYVYIFDYQ